MGILGPETDGNPSPWWEKCYIFGAILNGHSWLLCCLFWPPTTPKQSTTSLMMFGDVVALSMKEEGHQWGWCTLWRRWAEIDDGHVRHRWGSSWWVHHPPAHFTTSDPFVDGKWRLWGLQVQPQPWQFWRLQQQCRTSLNGRGGFRGPRVNPLWMGTPHEVKKPSLMCGEGFPTIWGEEDGWLVTSIWIQWNQRKWSATPQGGCWLVFPFLWSKIGARRPSRHCWKAENQLYFYPFKSILFLYGV